MHGAAIALITAICQAISVPQEATLLFAGDAMMHQGQIDAAKRPDGTYDYSECFARIAPQVSEADYAVVNLETPLGGAPYSGYPCFCAPDSYADALADAGFDLFLTANNHTLDRHDRGLRRTVEVLDGKHLEHIGTYADAAARKKALPLIKDIRGIKVAFLNYTYGTNGIEVQTDAVVDYIDRPTISADIKQARQMGAELVCVAVHWGNEYQLLPHSTQRSLADYLVEQGADMVIGGHPHVIQPMEMRRKPDGKNALVVYSLGNLISNMKTRDTRGGAIVTARISRDSDGCARVDTANYRLVFVVPGSPGGRNYRLVDADSCDSPAWQSACNAFRSSARAIFDKHNKRVAPL